MTATEQMPVPGRFITFEGIDGAGKSTHLARAVEQLRAAGISVVQTREPGGTALAESLRSLMLNEAMGPRTELLLMFAARDDHVRQCIAPALAAGHWVVCDRFTDSSFAYQGGGRQMSWQEIETLAGWVEQGIEITRTYLFELPAQVAAQRRLAARPADRFEQENLAFFERVREGYRRRAAMPGQQARFHLLDASAAPPVIGAALAADLAQLIRRWRPAS
ncbi:MAG: dTMP kinase [Burkholderiaceae bacterium]